jgi:hypothetical protein
MRWWLACLLLLTVAGPARAEYVSGNELFDRCSAPHSAAESNCLGFVLGVADTVVAYQVNPKVLQQVCIPSSATAEQLLDVVRKYLVANPEQRGWTATLLVFNALLSAFPCPR